MVEIGRLNKRISFFGPVKVINPNTHITTQEKGLIMTVWASVETNSGKQYKDVEVDRNRVIWDVYVRKIPQLENAHDMEIKYKEHRFEITAVLPTRDGDMLHFICQEVIQ